MTQATVAELLEQEHRTIDAGLEAAREGVSAGQWRVDSLASAVAALRRHIYVEEELLFPPMREAGLFGPVKVMLMEHAEIWRTLDRLEDLARLASDRTGWLEAYDHLARLLHDHNEKEELILYPQVANLAPGGAQARALEVLRSGSLPTGWRCQALAQQA